MTDKENIVHLLPTLSREALFCLSEIAFNTINFLLQLDILHLRLKGRKSDPEWIMVSF